MDNDQLVDKVQVLLLGMEERTNERFDRIDERFERIDEWFDRIDERFDKVDDRLDRMDKRLGAVETKLDSTSREVALTNQLLAPFINWSHRIEDEVIRLSAEPQDVQARLAKLENPSSQ